MRRLFKHTKVNRWSSFSYLISPFLHVRTLMMSFKASRAAGVPFICVSCCSYFSNSPTCDFRFLTCTRSWINRSFTSSIEHSPFRQLSACCCWCGAGEGCSVVMSEEEGMNVEEARRGGRYGKVHGHKSDAKARSHSYEGQP